MKVNNYNETERNHQKSEMAKECIKALEKITGLKVLNTQSDYDSLSDFSVRIKNYDELNYTDIENPVKHISLTEEQLETFINEIKSI